MKKILLSFALVFSLAQAFSQGKSNYEDFNIPLKENQPFYEFVDSIAAKGKSSEEIFTAARKSFADLFKNSKEVIEIEDKTKSTITGKGITSFNFKIGAMGITDEAHIKFSINFQGKNSKYRIQIYDFSYRVGKNSYQYQPLDKMLVLAKKYRINFLTEFHVNQQTFIKLFSETIIKNLNNNNSDF